MSRKRTKLRPDKRPHNDRFVVTYLVGVGDPNHRGFTNASGKWSGEGNRTIVIYSQSEFLNDMDALKAGRIGGDKLSQLCQEIGAKRRRLL
jgi:hypothetical protein